MRLYTRSSIIGTIDGKPAIAYLRKGDAKKGEPADVIYWRMYVSSDTRDAAVLDDKQEVISR